MKEREGELEGEEEWWMGSICRGAQVVIDVPFSFSSSSFTLTVPNLNLFGLQFILYTLTLSDFKQINYEWLWALCPVQPWMNEWPKLPWFSCSLTIKYRYLRTLATCVKFWQLEQCFCRHIFIQDAIDNRWNRCEKEIEEDEYPIINHRCTRESTENLVPK